jgi:hypothetical protein
MKPIEEDKQRKPKKKIKVKKICFKCGTDKNITTNAMGINTCIIH